MQSNNYRNTSRVWTGLLLITAGLLLLAYKMGAPVPDWLFTWPVALIVIGLLLGIKHRFRNNIWIILTLIGGINLVNQLWPELNFDSYIVPIIIIVIGIIFILRPSRGWKRQNTQSAETYKNEWQQHVVDRAKIINDGAEYIDSVSVFGGVKKMILSKNFKGGEITCFMGGAEINLTQADIQNEVVIEVTQIFGGTKIIVPPHWNVKSEVIAVFGGVDDKRPMQVGNPNPDKTLVLRGISVFGGIDIRSY